MELSCAVLLQQLSSLLVLWSVKCMARGLLQQLLLYCNCHHTADLCCGGASAERRVVLNRALLVFFSDIICKGRATGQLHDERAAVTAAAAAVCEEVAAPSMQARTEAESPGPLMQGCLWPPNCSCIDHANALLAPVAAPLAAAAAAAAAAACRAIDRAGGLDRYLLKTPDSLLYSDLGSDLKFRIGLLYRHKWYEQRKQQGQQQLQLPGTAAKAAADKAAAQLAGGGRRSRSLLPPAAAAALEKATGQQ
jgi:hypothetical protein